MPKPEARAAKRAAWGIQTPACRIRQQKRKEQAQRQPAMLASGCSSHRGRLRRTRPWKRSNHARPSAFVAGRFQQAQPGRRLIKWPLPRVGRRLATWSQLTTEGGFRGDVNHVPIRPTQESQKDLPSQLHVSRFFRSSKNLRAGVLQSTR